MSGSRTTIRARPWMGSGLADADAECEALSVNSTHTSGHCVHRRSMLIAPASLEASAGATRRAGATGCDMTPGSLPALGRRLPTLASNRSPG